MIHPLACVSEDSIVHETATIRQFANVCRNAYVGENVSIAPYTSVDGAIVKSGTVISMWTSIPPGWEVGHNCFIGPAVILVNDVYPSASKEGFPVNDLIALHTFDRIGIIKDRAVIGAQCTIMAGVTIGEGAVVPAGSVVTKDVPDGMMLHPSKEFVPAPKNQERLRYVKHD